MEYEYHDDSPKTISEVVIGLMTGTIAIGILCVLYILVKLAKVVFLWKKLFLFL